MERREAGRVGKLIRVQGFIQFFLNVHEHLRDALRVVLRRAGIHFGPPMTILRGRTNLA